MEKQKEEISEKMQHFCYERIHELASAFNSVLLAGKQYEVAFDEVMNMLGVPETERQDFLLQMFYFSEASGILYHKLTPLNQFIVTIPPYVFYCLRNTLPADEALRKEAHTILNDEASPFPRYLQEELGVKISQEIKGALWRPGPIWLNAMFWKILVCFFAISFTALFFYFKESTVLRISSYVAGVVITTIWAYYLFAGRVYSRAVGSIHLFTLVAVAYSSVAHCDWSLLNRQHYVYTFGGGILAPS